jgi:geranylgeranyl pyrophosphate synthase
VIDQAGSRRGLTSVNAKWGNAVAILGGDALLALALQLVSKVERSPSVDGLTEELTSVILDLIRGEAMELLSCYDVTRSRRHYERTIDLKTARLFEFAASAGAAVAGAGAEASAAAATFGRAFGFVFQLVDDLLDVCGSPSDLGKPVMTDQREGVYTLPLLIAMQRDKEVRMLVRSPYVDSDQLRSRIVQARGTTVAALRAEKALATARRLLARIERSSVRSAYAEFTELLSGQLRACRGRTEGWIVLDGEEPRHHG